MNDRVDRTRRTPMTRRGLLAAGVLAVPLLATTGPALADPGDDGTTILDVPLVDQPLVDAGDGSAVRVIETEAATLVGCSWSTTQPESIAARALLAGSGAWTEWFELDALTDPEDGSTTTGTQAAWLGGPVRRIEVRALLGGQDATADLVAHVVTTTRRSEDGAKITPKKGRSALATSLAVVPGVGAPGIVTRAGWGADESLVKGSPSYANELKAAVLHHTEGSNTYSAADVPGILRGILKYHTQTQGWNDIGYNILVDRFGTIYEGRAGGLNRHVVGAHATGSNTGTLGVSMIGSNTSAAPTDAQLNAVADVMAWKLGGSYIFDVHSTSVLDDKVQPRVFGHRDARSVSTDCPGRVGYQQLPRLRDLVQQRLAGRATVSYTAYRRAGGVGSLGTVTSVEQNDGSTATTSYSSGAVLTYVAGQGAAQLRSASGSTTPIYLFGPVPDGYYLLEYADDIYAVERGVPRALNGAQWAALGYPKPVIAPTEYVRYPWSSTISAVTRWGDDSRNWTWQVLSGAAWARAGYPAPRNAGYIAGSTFYTWSTDPGAIFVDEAGGGSHQLTYAEWVAAGKPRPESRSNQGFQKLSWDAGIARMTDVSAGRGGPISGSQWRDAGYPAPQVVKRFPGDTVYWGADRREIWYAGPSVNRPLSYAEWVALGSPMPR